MTKTEIMQAAFKVWGREFYFNTSLSHVARELKVCKPALYRHFMSKQALLDAMTTRFFDDLAGFIRNDYEKALGTGDSGRGVFMITRSIAEYFARNVYVFIFSMIKLQNRQLEGFKIVDELHARGVDLLKFHHSNQLIMRLIYATLVFFMADFHKRGKSFMNTPTEASIAQIIDMIGNIIGGGLCYTKEEIDALDYEGLENRIAGTINTIGDDPLLKAVAEAVATAGPWEASMEQIARRSGLAKSSLYSRFRGKQDMLRQLFMTETVRIIEFARQGMKQSAIPHEQLYLGIISIVEYLRSKRDILVTMDWLRNRRPDFDPENKPPPPNTFLRIFEDIDISSLRGGESLFNSMPQDSDLWLSPWILFLIINTLMLRNAEQAASPVKSLDNVQMSDIRSLHRFLTLGIGGFSIK
ncbi:MAG: TetR/AcrR family transcriptional regulator [Treponema sp.]|jgi:AcrR family transcriptional regulator|nr:TetR/AcrR family transcriptional regulator [Treponema sp.]